ncbi:hypothetical protein M1M34_gp054 [Haloarcula tailed virus 2]|uniref:Uncharacterized protein n=1 Tax=Haloarcula tailed virus 2 TaxID=2877989 RepID=A0AAE8XYX6_9CAUD|nr:hypothetical protein M1M34_gp054 [Haloarcula tailed virus 2]UBF23205.1 hypothetical protein HATV-2_gp54 [Haloarcula tailed virus 2]
MFYCYADVSMWYVNIKLSEKSQHAHGRSHSAQCVTVFCRYVSTFRWQWGHVICNVIMTPPYFRV